MRLRTLRSSLKSQKGFSIASVTFCVLGFSILGLTMAPMVGVSSRGSVGSNQGQEAFFVANGGMQYILQNSFAGDSDFSDNTSPTGAPFGGTSITLGTGQFWVEYSNLTATSADIAVTGQAGNSVRKITQSVTAASTPPSATVQVNGSLDLTGDGQVDGDIEYSGSLNNNLYTINGDTNSGGSSPPAVDLTSLISQTTSVYSGDLTINGDYTGNVHVTGDLFIEGSGTITGVIVSENNVEINAGNVTMLGTLAAKNNIILKYMSDSTFEAQMGPGGVMNPVLIAQGDVSMDVDRDNTDIILRGLVHAGNVFELNIKGSNSTLLIEGVMMSANSSKLASQSGAYITLDVGAGQAYLNGSSTGGLTLGEWKEA